MKITSKDAPFQPFTITVETVGEARVLWDMVNRQAEANGWTNYRVASDFLWGDEREGTDNARLGSPNFVWANAVSSHLFKLLHSMFGAVNE